MILEEGFKDFCRLPLSAPIDPTDEASPRDWPPESNSLPEEYPVLLLGAPDE
jgi:hypothetical protein